MIIIGGQKDLTKKVLKHLVQYQDYQIINSTGDDEYLSEVDSIQKNGFCADEKIYTTDPEELSHILSRREYMRHAQARENFFANNAFRNDMLDVLNTFLKNHGKINIFIILKQKAYKGIGKEIKENFDDVIGVRDESSDEAFVVNLWEDIENEVDEALVWTPSDDVLRRIERGCHAEIESDEKIREYHPKEKKKKKDVPTEEKKKKKKKKKFFSDNILDELEDFIGGSPDHMSDIAFGDEFDIPKEKKKKSKKKQKREKEKERERKARFMCGSTLKAFKGKNRFL